MPASPAMARSARSARPTCRPMPPACAPGIEEIGPKLLGLDPRDLGVLNRRMDQALRGHPYVKSGIDVACWDILGKATGPAGGDPARRALWRGFPALSRDLAGEPAGHGRSACTSTAPRATPSSSSRSAAIPTSTSSASAPRSRELKPGDVLIADANTGWLMHQATRVVDAVQGHRRLYRAALHELRGMPRDPRAHRSGRSSSTR